MVATHSSATRNLGMSVALVAGVGLLLLIWFWRRAPESNSSPSSSSVSPDDPWFEDVTERFGVEFTHDPGPVDGQYFMPQIVGSGAALFDFNNDDLLDIYLVNNGGPNGRPNVLYQQVPGGKFRDVSRGSGLDVSGYGMGVAIGDINNDGFLDIAATEFGALRLFLNQGEGKFKPLTAAGVESPLWGTSACFIDYDRDGWLDLAVANYLDYDPAWPCTNAAGVKDYCHPKVFPGVVAKLFRNLGAEKSADEPKFEDATAASGLARSPGPGLGIVCADFNDDRWPDIFVTNDAHPNHLWINQQDGTFAEEGVQRGLAYDAVGRSLANMGVALGDTTGQGRFDVFVTHLPEETHTLWRQEMPGTFADRSASTGLLRCQWRATGFGTVLADFNQDGNLDLSIVNGRVVQAGSGSPKDHWSAYAERNQLFAADAPGKFRDISSSTPALCGAPNVARGLCVGDIDNDGALDLLCTCTAGRPRLLLNVTKLRGTWLTVRGIDPRLNRDAYGAQITLLIGNRRQVSWLIPGQSFLASNDPRVHFGLATATLFDGIEVLWPDGLLERFPGGPVNRHIKLRRGEGQPVESFLPAEE